MTSRGDRTGSLVDVIVPAYNASRFLRTAVDSALGQTGVSLRVIVTDDGSTDDTADIARSYGPRVNLVSQENRGLPGARNSAIGASSAPYLALLDADDLWRPGKIARQAALLEAHPEVGLVFTDMTIFKGDFETGDFAIEEDGFLLEAPPYAALERRLLGDGAYLLPRSVGDTVMRYNFISPSTVMLRREAIMGVGGFDEAFRVCEDVECWLRILRTWRAISIEERLVLSRRWEGNLTTQSEKMIRGRLQLGEKVFTHPELYPPAARPYFGREKWDSFYRLGRVALHAGDVRGARRHMLRSLRGRPRPETLLLLAATLVGSRGRQLLLRLKRSAGLRLPTGVD